MSETTTSQALDPGQDRDQPGAAETEAPAPAEKGAAPDQDEEDRHSGDRVERRIARMTARMAAMSRERDELAQRLAQAQAKPGQPVDDAALQRARAEVRQQMEAERAEERRAAFHDAGHKAYRDWDERCENLIAMGADPQLASMLVRIENGPRVAGALADDPKALQRIADMKEQTDRAIALGEYAASLRATQGGGGVSRAPAPIRPVTGRAAAFNEYTADTNALLDYYSKQAQERHRRT